MYGVRKAGKGSYKPGKKDCQELVIFRSQPHASSKVWLADGRVIFFFALLHG